MNEATLERSVARFVHREAWLLDQKQWADWLDMYDRDAVYWVPAWANEHQLTNDPGNELSLIYIDGRSGLEDRVFRLETDDSMASVPADRTVHLIGGVIVQPRVGNTVEATASWLTHSYGVRGPRLLGGSYDYTLRIADDDRLAIARKRIVMINDGIEGPVDIYHL